MCDWLKKIFLDSVLITGDENTDLLQKVMWNKIFHCYLNALINLS